MSVSADGEPGDEVALFKEDLGLRQSEVVDTGADTLIHEEGMARGGSEEFDPGQDVVLFTENMAQGPGRGKILHFQYEEDQFSDFSVWNEHLDEETGSPVEYYTTADGNFRDFASGQRIVIVSFRGNEEPPDQADLDAFAELWDSGSHAVLLTEDDKPSVDSDDKRLYRQEAANDFVDEVLGVRPFPDDTDLGSGDCFDSGIPTDSHPIFEDVEEIYRAGSEATVESTGDIEAVSSDPDNVWGYYEQDNQRMWLDGGLHRFDDFNEEYPYCADDELLGRQLASWIDTGTAALNNPPEG